MSEAEKTEEGTQVETASAEAMLEMILSKEDEVKTRIAKAESEALRLVEEAKLDAAAMKREAAIAKVGQDLRDKELENARKEAEKVSAEIGGQAQGIRAKGIEQVREAADIVTEAVLPRQ